MEVATCSSDDSRAHLALLTVITISFGVFFKIFIYFYREGKEGRKRGRETSMCDCLSRTSPTGDLACNPGIYPYCELNQPPIGSQVCTQSTEPHQPGPGLSERWELLRCGFDFIYSVVQVHFHFCSLLSFKHVL